MQLLEKLKKNIYGIMAVLALILFTYNLFMLGYINLFQMKYHLGYDASSYYLKAYVMWEQGTFFPNLWSEQTTLYLDSAVSVAAILQNITNNIWVSYGLANIIIDFGLIAVLIFIMKDLELDQLTVLVVLDMFLCPYYTMQFNNVNDVEWYSSLLTSGCWYGAKTLIILLVLKTILSMEKGRRAYVLMALTSLMSLVTGLSSGYYVLVTVFFPAMVYFLIKVLIKNDWKALKCKTVCYILVNSAIIVIGKKIAVNVIGFTSKDSDMVLTGLQDFWKNLGSIFLGFIQLVGGMHTNSDVAALTSDGIAYMSGFGIIIICLISLVYYVVKMADNLEGDGFFFVFLILMTNIIMFIVLYTTYGQPIFEVRYLCILYIMLMMLVGYYLSRLDNQMIWKGVVTVGLLGALAFKSYMGFGYYNQTKIDLDYYKQMIAKVNEVDTPVVYILGNELGIEGRNLRILDTEHVYKIIDELMNCSHWGDYMYYDENGSWQGNTVIISTAEKFELLPPYIKKLYFQYETLGNYNFYKSNINRFDYNVNIMQCMDSYVDYMTSPGYVISNGEINNEDGTYTVNGYGGYVMSGPYAKIEAGTYNIALDYELLAGSGNLGRFEVSINNGMYVVASVPLDTDAERVMLKGVQFEEDAERMEYRCYLEDGAILKLKWRFPVKREY